LDLEQLKHRNSSATEALEQPYQPIIYAIPKAHWEAMMGLMKENLPFMDTMATEENMAYYYQEISKTLCCLTDNQSNHQKEMSSQVGKVNEQNSRWVRDLEASLKNQAEQNQKKLWKHLSILIGAQTIILSLLTILLTWILR